MSGWRFAEKDEDVAGEHVTPDPVHEGYTHLRDIYFENNKDYDGRFTVPTLYDVKQKRIVNNESSEIIRMMYHAFDDLLPDKYKKIDLLPSDLEKQIEEVNEWTYNDINNGVYKSGFATYVSDHVRRWVSADLLRTQEAYEKNVTTLFTALDRAEADLEKYAGPFYLGERMTELDVRLYTTIIRFDPVYVQHFRCNIRDIRSGYPNLHRYSWAYHVQYAMFMLM